jgi:SPP1 gp7 family putative phage head morphogenesis protein
MPSLNDEIRDLLIRHQVGLQRLSTSTLRKIVKLLDEADADIVAKLLARAATLEGSFTSQRLKYLLDALRVINRDAFVRLGKELRKELQDLARYEVEYQIDMLTRTIPVAVDIVSPSAPIIDAIVTSRPFQGALLREVVRDMERSKLKAVSNAVRLGMIEGESMEQIVRRVRGTKAMNYKDGALAAPRASAERIVRTAVNHIANAAREELFEQNDDLIKEYQAVATLDTRTCPRCAALDGKRYKVGDKRRPRYPLHLQCRCVYVPITKTWRELGVDADEVPPSTRASMNGQVSATETYATWLKKQSAAVQDDALGPTRGALFRRGGLDVDRFTNRAGDQWTLDELRARESGAFAKAGLAA